MTTDETRSTTMQSAAKLVRLQAAVEQGRNSGISDRSADEIRAEAKAAMSCDRPPHSAFAGS